MAQSARLASHRHRRDNRDEDETASAVLVLPDRAAAAAAEGGVGDMFGGGGGGGDGGSTTTARLISLRGARDALKAFDRGLGLKGGRRGGGGKLVVVPSLRGVARTLRKPAQGSIIPVTALLLEVSGDGGGNGRRIRERILRAIVPKPQHADSGRYTSQPPSYPHLSHTVRQAIETLCDPEDALARVATITKSQRVRSKKPRGRVLGRGPPPKPGELPTAEYLEGGGRRDGATVERELFDDADTGGTHAATTVEKGTNEEPSPSIVEPKPDDAVLDEGMEVEAQYKGRSKWKQGKTRCRTSFL